MLQNNSSLDEISKEEFLNLINKKEQEDSDGGASPDLSGEDESVESFTDGSIEMSEMPEDPTTKDSLTMEATKVIKYLEVNKKLKLKPKDTDKLLEFIAPLMATVDKKMH